MRGLNRRLKLFRLRVEGSKISPLVSVASPAGVGKILGFGLTTMLCRDHVIYLVWEEAYLCREQTILASSSGPLDDLTPQ